MSTGMMPATLSAISNDELTLRIKDSLGGLNKSLAELKPLVEEAWRRLEDGQTVSGCRTKTEFSEKVLGKTLRAVQYMLAGGNQNRTEYVPASSVSLPVHETVSPPRDNPGEAPPAVEAALPSDEYYALSEEQRANYRLETVAEKRARIRDGAEEECRRIEEGLQKQVARFGSVEWAPTTGNSETCVTDTDRYKLTMYVSHAAAEKIESALNPHPVPKVELLEQVVERLKSSSPETTKSYYDRFIKQLAKRLGIVVESVQPEKTREKAA